MLRGKVTDTRRRPSCDRLDIVRETIIAIGGVEAGHGQEVLEDMLGQIAAVQLLVPPLLQWYIDISDGSPGAERQPDRGVLGDRFRGPVGAI